MGKKDKYSIVINSRKKPVRKFYFDYRSTKNICASVGNKFAEIQIEYCPKSNSLDDNLKENTVIKDAIKKAALIHLLINDKPLFIKQIAIYKNRNKVNVKKFLESDICLYCLVEQSLERPVSGAWKNDAFIGGLLKLNLTDDSKLIASIYSFLASKSSKYEYQRFVSLWTSMNGLYGYIYPKERTNKTDRAKIENILVVKSFGEEFPSSKVNEDLVEDVKKYVLEHIENNESKNKTKEDDSDLYRKIEKLLQEKNIRISPKGYLLFGLPYYYRCELIHGGKPLPLLSFGIEPEVKILNFMNNLLESFLDENIPIEVQKVKQVENKPKGDQ